MARIYEIFPVLAERRRDKAGALSGGQGRMLSVAREMITEPRLMLVDEPTVGLAPNLVEQVYDCCRRRGRRSRPPSCWSTRTSPTRCGRPSESYMMNLGTVKAAGPAAEFGEQRVRDADAGMPARMTRLAFVPPAPRWRSLVAAASLLALVPLFVTAASGCM